MSRLRVGPVNQRAVEALVESPLVEGQLEDLADDVVTGAQRRAPVRTGRLRRSLTKERAAEGGGFDVGWDRAEAPYGPIVEFRHQEHLRPAVEEIQR